MTIPARRLRSMQTFTTLVTRRRGIRIRRYTGDSGVVKVIVGGQEKNLHPRVLVEVAP